MSTFEKTKISNDIGQTINPQIEEKQDSLIQSLNQVEEKLNDLTTNFNEESLWLLRRMVKLMESNGTVDGLNRQRVVVDSTVGIIPNAYYAGANQFNIPNSTVFAPLNQASATYVQPVQTGPVDPRWAIIDQARLVYNQGIRSHLSFS